MKNMKFLVLVFMSLTLGLTSCKKEEECEDPTPLSEVLTGTWTYEKSIYYEDGVLVEEELAEDETQFVFTSNHVLTITGGEEVYSWELNEDGDILYLSDVDDESADYDSFSFDVDLLNTSNFTFSESYVYDGVIEKREWILTR